jgi:hypothetical protein
VLLVVALGACLGALPALADSATRDTAGLVTFAAHVPIPDTSSQLVRNDNGVNMTIHTNGLTPGTATTVWWVVFNHPTLCSHGDGRLRCGLGDLFVPAVAASVQFAAGHVIGADGGGNFGSYLSEGDTSGCATPGGPLPCNGLLDARTADVHLVVRTHGDAIPGLVSEQISSFNGGCLAGEPNVGQCLNLQSAPHEAR